MDANRLMITKREAADLAGCSVASIDRMCDRGELEFTRLSPGPRGGVRINRDSFLQRFGLASRNEVRRRSAKAEAERVAAVALWGVA